MLRHISTTSISHGRPAAHASESFFVSAADTSQIKDGKDGVSISALS